MKPNAGLFVESEPRWLFSFNFYLEFNASHASSQLELVVKVHGRTEWSEIIMRFLTKKNAIPLFYWEFSLASQSSLPA